MNRTNLKTDVPQAPTNESRVDKAAMNRTNLKNYAPQARREFIQAMKDRAGYYGLTNKNIEPVVEKGDVAIIAGLSHPSSVAKKRKALEDRIKQHGFEQTMEALAYTWFNRLVAIRFMELHGYLDHGYRVLSHPEGKPTPELLEHAEHVDLPGLKRDAVIDLKLAGNKEGDLYRLLLTAQCNALHAAMPFLFEKIDDETELLLPDNLLHSDSLIRKLVNEIDEQDWQQVEIIGWLYQFYISQKKDEVIGKVVASEDVPAATQLFTPNWIVKYLVQNTLGRQWLATYPHSALRQQMEYYIEPARQTPEVQEQLKASTPTSLNPEELTLLDPACGSGHILVEAYDLFKAIYQERGYRAKDIPALILQKNLFGLEIDDRAAQLAAFALMMKARADDRRIFDSAAKPNIVAIQDSRGLNAASITHALNSPINKDELPPSKYLFEEIEEAETPLFSKKVMAEKGHVSQADIAHLLELFANAKTFGSLIQIPPKMASKLPEIEKRLNEVLKFGDLTHASAQVLIPLLTQTRLLSRQYDAVVANPPYMGSKYMAPLLKEFIATCYRGFHADLYAAFIRGNTRLAKANGRLGFMSPFTWMFITSHECLREHLLDFASVSTLIQLEYSGFTEATVPICTFTVMNSHIRQYAGSFIRLSEFRGAEQQGPRTVEAIKNHACGWYYECSADEFRKIPGSPFAYWATASVRRVFERATPFREFGEPRMGMATGNNDKHLRLWHEVSYSRIGFACRDRTEAQKTEKKWFPYNKGGDFRLWFGNNEYVVNWENDGLELQTTKHPSGRIWAHNFNLDYIFKPCITWTATSSSYFGVRLGREGFLFDCKGSSAFVHSEDLLLMLGLLASSVNAGLMKILNPTIEFQSGNVATIPVLKKELENRRQEIEAVVSSCVSISEADWNTRETSWDFKVFPLLTAAKPVTVNSAYEGWTAVAMNRRLELMRLQEANNRLFIEAYGLQDELSPEVPDDQITLYRPDREEDIKRLLSYAIGCMMGRFSLDKPGLIYAHSGNQCFDPSQYKTFPADPDGIIPLLETDWGIRDDATNRTVEFITVAWPKEHLEENLKFIADCLGPNNGGQPRETIRRYLATGFFKHHLSMYKKRPIYWMISSGKQRAFQCLVYLHRYHEGTLARMRTEYVIPLQGQIAARIEQLEGDKAKATSTSHRNKLQKAQDDLKKQQAELHTFEENLKHAADQKISLDLDDGVKVNYAKFGDLLAESKAITGGKDDE
jgi:type II restriction/modification system DNA methylase subunit YeeA